MIKLFTRHLYVRIWLAVLAGVAVVVFAAGWAWREADEQRTQPLPRDVTLRDTQDQLIGTGKSLRTSRPGEPLEFTITLNNGQQFVMELGPRGERRPSPPPWLNPRTGIFWLLGMVGLATALGLFPIVRRLTQRLESVQRSVQRFGEGDLSARARDDGEDEVADLARRFNDAATRIEQLIRSHKSLLANASHELRSPLTRIRMGLELMGDKPSPTAKAEISRNIAELDQLIDEILLSSRLDAREADMGTVETVDLMGLAAEECARVEADLDVAEGTDIAALTVRGVPRLLRRAVRNLLENARRYGKTPGKDVAQINIQAQAHNDAVLLKVRDHGAGVAPALLSQLTKPFFRGDVARTSAAGAGLGLSIVAKNIERMGGTFALTSTPGRGFAAHIRMQRASTQAAAATKEEPAETA